MPWDLTSWDIARASFLVVGLAGAAWMLWMSRDLRSFSSHRSSSDTSHPSPRRSARTPETDHEPAAHEEGMAA